MSAVLTAVAGVAAPSRAIVNLFFGQTAYVTNLGSNNVSVINAFINTVTATVAVGHQQHGVALARTPGCGCL
jgi:YVTN family beta-propeller protein